MTDNSLRKQWTLYYFLLMPIFFSACTTKDYVANFRTTKLDSGFSTKKDVYIGHYKTGPSYKTRGNLYHPIKEINENLVQVGIASWYGKKDHGKQTANGEIFNSMSLTAAHKEFPLPSLALVENLKNGKNVVVVINDRGPFVKNRIIDVSEKVATILDFKKLGISKVKVTYLYKETKEFLEHISLTPKHGSKATHQAKNKCSSQCYVRIINKKMNTSILKKPNSM